MNNIKELRKEKNLTQSELATYFGIDQTTVSKWELNKALPDTLMLIELADFFGVSIDYLLSRSTYYFPNDIDAKYYLSDEENSLVDNYRELNVLAKKHIRDTIKMLRASSAGSEQNKNKS